MSARTFADKIRASVAQAASPKAKSARLASFARKGIAEIQKRNEAAIGEKQRPPKITVDGRKGVPLSSVRPDGSILAEWNVQTRAVRWIREELDRISPEVSGRYERAHTIFIDGKEFTGEGEIPDGKEYILVNMTPYARRLDRIGSLQARSKQAPRGVYAAIAAVAATRFVNEAEITYTFVEMPVEGSRKPLRQPAIQVVPRG